MRDKPAIRKPTFVAIAVATSFVIAAASILLTGGSASAHALLVRSDPVVDSRLVEPPVVVTAWFSESLDPSLSTMRVLDGTGERVDIGGEGGEGVTFSGEDPKMMRVGIQEGIPPGFYAVIWETLSSVDGHFIKGTFPFTVLNPDGSEPSGPIPEVAGIAAGGEPTIDSVAGKVGALVGTVGLMGSIAFAVLVVGGAVGQAPREWQQRVRDAGRRHALWTVWPALGLLAVAGLVEVMAQARQLGGVDLLGKLLSETDWGERWIQRQVVLVAIVLAVTVATVWGRRREVLWRAALWAALLGACGYALLVSLVSHAGAVEGSFWAVSSDFVHLVAAVVWIGMLARLGLLLVWARRELPENARVLSLAAHVQRFSVLAAISVIALLATGTFSAFTQVPTSEALVETSYGRALLAKLALVAILLPVAGFNAVVLRPRVLRRVASSGREAVERLQRLLTRAVWLEAALAVGVFAIVGVLTQYPTARVTVESESFVRESAEAVVGYESNSQAGDLGVNISVSPNTVGTNSYQVFLFPELGESLSEVLQVRLRFRPPDPELGPSEVIADEVNPNFFKATGSYFITGGDWEVQVDIRRAEVDDVSTLFRIPVQAAGGALGGGSDRFALPLVSGSWATVAALALLTGVAVFWVPAQQWPGIHVRAARWLRMSGITSGVVGLAILLGIHQHVGLTTETAREGNPVAPTEESVARGRASYEANCVQCHGLSGGGDGLLAASLAVPPADFDLHVPFHTDLFFFQVITRGFGDIMPPFGDQITEQDRWNLINFLRAEHSLEAQGE